MAYRFKVKRDDLASAPLIFNKTYEREDIFMVRVYNFSAGPSTLPVSVLEKAGAEILDYKGSGQSVMEMSHRSKVFDEIIKDAEALMRELYKIVGRICVSVELFQTVVAGVSHKEQLFLAKRQGGDQRVVVVVNI